MSDFLLERLCRMVCTETSPDIPSLRNKMVQVSAPLSSILNGMGVFAGVPLLTGGMCHNGGPLQYIKLQDETKTWLNFFKAIAEKKTLLAQACSLF